MMRPVVPERSARVLIFVLLTGLMVLAGAHLLETVCYTYYSSTGKGDSAEGGKGIPFHTRGGEPLSLVQLGYRYVIAGAFLVLGYQGLALQLWARKWLIRLLLLDLAAWLFHALRYLFLQPSFVLSTEQIMLEIFTVMFEGGLLWLLVQPASLGHFASREKRSSIPA